MDETIKLWYDAEGDYLEVLFRNSAGSYREAPTDGVMAKFDQDGRLIGLFSQRKHA